MSCYFEECVGAWIRVPSVVGCTAVTLRLHAGTSTSLNLSNEEILELSTGKNGPKLHSDASVIKLTPSTVAKASQDLDKDAADTQEANALDSDLLFAETTIPVSRLLRCETPMGLLDRHGQAGSFAWTSSSTWIKS